MPARRCPRTVRAAHRTPAGGNVRTRSLDGRRHNPCACSRSPADSHRHRAHDGSRHRTRAMTPPDTHRTLTYEDMRCEPFMSGEVVRTDGFCGLCDSWFRNEWALKYPDSSSPSGWGYLECWHLFERGILTPP